MAMFFGFSVLFFRKLFTINNLYVEAAGVEPRPENL